MDSTQVPPSTWELRDLDNAVQVARPLLAWEKAFNTETLKRYSHESNHAQASGIGELAWPHDNYHLPSRYLDFPLYMCRPHDKPLDIPQKNIRIDDRSITSFTHPYTPAQLHRAWPAEFDEHGNLRAKRVPLGLPSKL